MKIDIAQAPKAAASSEEYYDLGSFHRSITTSSEDTQLWFNRGLVLTYGFNHDEAVKCFEYAVAHDPDCPMAYWGVAYACGPNYNRSWSSFDEKELKSSVKKGYDAIERAKSVMGSHNTRAERALVNAMQYRYQQDHPGKDLMTWSRAYADAMGDVYEKFSDDFDIVALYADAMMNLTPWALWDLRSGKPAPGARTMESKKVLEQAFELEGAYEHPGVLHMYIHLMEMSSTPEAALRAADALRPLAPDSGHLRHMPSHIDVLVGDYRRAIASNIEAVEADDKFVAREGIYNFFTLYRMHNLQSLVYAGMLAGRSKVALEATTKMEKSLPDKLLRVQSPPMANWTEIFLSVRMHVLIRFGLWNEILALKLPDDQDLYCVTTATIQYAKGIAFAVLGRIEEADKQRDLLRAAIKRVPPGRMDFPNKCIDILAVAEAMLDGEFEYRRGNYGVAFKHLRTAVHLDDSLIYTEPWGWMMPTRHAYAALLLEQGHVEEAAAAYSEDLGFEDHTKCPSPHPNNVWALHGYHECLVKLERTSEAKIIKSQLKLALAGADVDITSSCLCRLDKVGAQKSKGGSCCSRI